MTDSKTGCREWLPIETAPDGERVEIKHEGHAWVGTGIKKTFGDADGHTTISCEVIHYNGTVLVPEFYATHWRPCETASERVCAGGVDGSPSCGHTRVSGLTCAEIGNPHCLHPCTFSESEPRHEEIPRCKHGVEGGDVCDECMRENHEQMLAAGDPETLEADFKEASRLHCWEAKVVVASDSPTQPEPSFAQIVRTTLEPIKGLVADDVYSEAFIRVLTLYTVTKALNRTAPATTEAAARRAAEKIADWSSDEAAQYMRKQFVEKVAAIITSELAGEAALAVEELREQDNLRKLALTGMADLLAADMDGLRRLWNQHYPERDLEKIANGLGYSFD